MTGRLPGVAVVTGATGGIGGALSAALLEEGTTLVLTGRRMDALQECARRMVSGTRQVLVHAADLSREDDITPLVDRVRAELGRIDILIHAAGAWQPGHIESVKWDDLDQLYRVNVRAPYLLTRSFLPMLKDSAGQIVFLGSSAAFRPGEDNTLYAATKAALHSLTISTRDHVNRYGIRVLSVHPGRTATAMQEAVHRAEGVRYEPSELLQPRDIAETVICALALPRTAEVTEIMLRPAKGPSARR